VHLAGRLANRPDHSEVANRGAGGPMSSFEQNHAFAPSRQNESVCQTQNASAHYGDVRFFRHQNYRIDGYAALWKSDSFVTGLKPRGAVEVNSLP
jgi:hypothetical protein